MVAEQYKILRNLLPLYRRLQDGGQIEVSTTPFYHPILPLLCDTALATLDKEGAQLPERFAWPEDAEAQIQHAVECYTQRFGRPPQGMWPAEGGVGHAVVPLFARHGIRGLPVTRESSPARVAGAIKRMTPTCSVRAIELKLKGVKRSLVSSFALLPPLMPSVFNMPVTPLNTSPHRSSSRGSQPALRLGSVIHRTGWSV